MSKSRFTSLDDACEHINQCRQASEPESPPPVEETVESRWWSYTSRQTIVPEGETVCHQVSDPEVSEIPGIHFQRCGGGRRVIRKNHKGK